MAKRTYNDLCGIARALDVVGERWALLVIRELVLGPKRFTDLRAGLPNVGPDVLAQRLRELEAAGLVTRSKLPPPAGARVYELTERGAGLEPLLVELGRWGSVVPPPSRTARLGVDSAVLALLSLFDAGAARDLDAIYELRLGDQPFAVRIADGTLDVERGEAESPVATITSDPATFAALLWQGRRAADAERSGELAITGSKRSAARFLRLFPLPG